MQVYVVNSTPVVCCCTTHHSTPVVCCCTMAGGGYMRVPHLLPVEPCQGWDEKDDGQHRRGVDQRSPTCWIISGDRPNKPADNDVTSYFGYFGWLFDIGPTYFCICSIPQMGRWSGSPISAVILFRWVDTTGIGWDWVKHHSLEAELGLGIEGCLSRSLLPPKWLSVSMRVQILLQSPLGWFKFLNGHLNHLMVKTMVSWCFL